MKALLLHIGADTSEWFTLRVNAPIFEDESFEFIPILEFLIDKEYIIRRQDGSYVVEKNGESQGTEVWTVEKRTYSMIEARNRRFGSTLADYLPFEYDNIVAHVDPDFYNMTYGDRHDDPRGKQIWRLEPGDYVFFVASLAPFVKDAYSIRTRSNIRRFQKGQMAKYIVGYFKIHKVYEIHRMYDETAIYIKTSDQNLVNDLENDVRVRLEQNAHFKRIFDDYSYVAVGDPSESAFLRRAVRLTEMGPPFRPNGVGRRIYGDKNFSRGFKWVHNLSVEILLNSINIQDRFT